MKVECLLEKFKASVNQLEKVAGKNLALPILGSICIQTDDKGLLLKATNLNIGAEVHIPAKIIEHGVVAVSASLLTQVCNGLSGDSSIQLDLVNENLIVSTKNSKMTIKSIDATDFPTLPRVENEEQFDISTEQFITGIRSVMYAAAQSDIKPEIASIYIYENNGSLTFVATDAFRLAEKKIPVQGIQQFPEILIPVKNISEIIRILGEYQGTISLTVNENQLALSNNQLYITSRLTSGTYPKYQQIMPTGSKSEMIVLKSDLQAMLKSLLVFSDKYNQIDLEINPTEKKCVITSRNNDTGEGIVQLEAALSGEALETRINYRYIIDALQGITTDSVVISFTEPQRPLLMKGVGDPSFTYLIMPMNR